MQGAALEEIEKLSLYEELLESMERVVYHLNLVSGSFEYISGAASSLFGLDPERVRDSGMELVGKHMVPGDYEAAMERIAEAAAANPGQRVTLAVHYRLIGADGKLRHCHDSMTVRVAPDGTPLAVYGVAVDVSDYLHVELAMHEKEAQFRATMEVAQVGIFLLQDALFRYVNPFLLQLFGYSEEEVVGILGPLDLIVAEDQGMVWEQMRLREAGEQGQPYEVTGLRKDGSTFPAVILGSPSVYDGRPASVGTVQDVSAQKQAEQRVRELADFDPLTACPTGGCCATAARSCWQGPSATGRKWRWSSSTSTISSGSTTRSGTASATTCCARWRSACRAPYARSTRSPGWVATNSSSRCPAVTPRRPPMSPRACSTSARRPSWWQGTS